MDNFIKSICSFAKSASSILLRAASVLDIANESDSSLEDNRALLSPTFCIDLASAFIASDKVSIPIWACV